MKFHRINSLTILLTFLFGVIIYFIIHIYTNMHHSSWDRQKNYTWIFKDSIIQYIDTNARFSWVKESDVLNHFIYDKHFPIAVWDFKDMKDIELKDASINYNVSTSDIEDILIGKGEVLNSRSNPEIAIKFNSKFDNKININLSKSSTVLKTFESKNYKGFYGYIDGMSFTNSKYDDYIYFRYPRGKMLTLLLLYKSSKGFFVIKIQNNDTKYKFDEHILDILRLE